MKFTHPMLRASDKAKEKAIAFFQHEAAGGVVLMAAAALALILANSPLAHWYDSLMHTIVSVQAGTFKLQKGLLHWINDGLMAIFFLLVGLEIKREMTKGALSSIDQASLPIIAALGGMVAPALIYVAINFGSPETLAGWAIPAATDIAFAIGVLALVGSSVPSSLKIFLLALAIIDDLGAIVIIALFYTADLSVTMLAWAGVAGLVLLALNLAGVTRIAPYMLAGAFMWFCVLKSGVHATLAGVATAFAIPLEGRTHEGDDMGPLETLEHRLHSWVTFGILPLFAFGNAGVSFAGITLSQVFGAIPLGIAAGLALGKPIGIVGACWLAVRSGLAKLPEGATWRQLVGIGCLGGIGFTMSLFIGMLAFPQVEHAAEVRIGVLLGSLISAMIGALVLTRLTGGGIDEDEDAIAVANDRPA